MPEDKISEVEVQKVKVRNATRSCVSFRVPGQSISLQPGQSVDLHKPYLETPELKALMRRGEVVSAAGPAAPAGEADPGGGTRGRGRGAGRPA